MERVNALNQNQVSPPLHCNARPELLNLKDGLISFLPHLPTRNEPNMDLHTLNPHILRNEYSLIQYPYLVASQPYEKDYGMMQSQHPLTNQLPGRDSRMIQDLNPLTNHLYRRDFRTIHGVHSLTNHAHGSVPNMPHNENSPQYQLFPSEDKKIQDFHQPTNQKLTNRSNLIQHSHLLQFKLSSNGAQVTENLHPITKKLSQNESNIQQQIYSLTHQLSEVGIDINQTSNMPIQKPYSNTSILSLVKQSPTSGLSQVELNRNQVNYQPTHQQYARESTIPQGLQSIFQRPCKNENLHSVTNKLSSNESNTQHQPCSIAYQLPEVGIDMNQISNMPNQKPYSNTSILSLVKQSPTSGLYEVGPNRNQANYLPSHQKNARESNIRQSLQSMFQRPCKNENLHSVTNKLSSNESNIQHQICSITHQLPKVGIDMNQNSNLRIQNPFTNTYILSLVKQSPTSGLSQVEPNINQVNLLPTHQQYARESTIRQGLQSIFQRPCGNENLHPVTNKLSSNESNTQHQPCSLDYQLPAVGIDMNQNSNMPIQKPYSNTSILSLVKQSPTSGLSQVGPNRNQANYLPTHQKNATESNIRQGLESIFQRPCKDGLFMVPGQKLITNQISYPSTTFPEIGFNSNRELSSVLPDLFITNTSLESNLYPQYSENVHICVVGPPGCGKADLIKTFARNENILIPNGKPFRKVFQQDMVCFRTNLIIDFWYVDKLNLAAEDLKFHCESSKSVLVLVYSVAQKTSLSTILEWIKFMKRDIVADVPIILVENNTNVESSFASSEFSGRVQEEYDLDAFYQCSTNCIEDVDAIFLFAAHKAFNRKIQSEERWIPRSF